MDNEEILSELENLFSYFDIGEEAEGDWPLCHVYYQGGVASGPIMDDLYDILVRLYEIYEEESRKDD